MAVTCPSCAGWTPGSGPRRGRDLVSSGAGTRPALCSPAALQPSLFSGGFRCDLEPLSVSSAQVRRPCLSSAPSWPAQGPRSSCHPRTWPKLMAGLDLPSCPQNFLGHLAASLWDPEFAPYPDHLAGRPRAGPCPSWASESRGTRGVCPRVASASPWVGGTGQEQL